MGGPELRVNEAALSWDPAEVTVPEVPEVKAGGDPMSALVSAVMPTVATDVTQKVAQTRAREEQFAANLLAARNAYRGADGAGGDQIGAAASGIGAPIGVPVSSAASAAGPAGGHGGVSQLSQLMGTAMQAGQQALQAPMQMVGMVGQLPQSVMPGVQGIVQQASQASEKAGGGAEGVGPEGGGLPESAADKSEDTKDAEQAQDETDKDHRKDKRSDESAAGADTDQHQRAPFDVSQAQPSTPGDVPRHRRLEDTSPEVVL